MVQDSADHQGIVLHSWGRMTLPWVQLVQQFIYASLLQIIICPDLYTIAAIKGDESYEQFAVGLKDVFDDVNYYLVTTDEGNVYSLELFLCADYKVDH